MLPPLTAMMCTKPESTKDPYSSFERPERSPISIPNVSAEVCFLYDLARREAKFQRILSRVFNGVWPIIFALRSYITPTRPFIRSHFGLLNHRSVTHSSLNLEWTADRENLSTMSTPPVQGSTVAEANNLVPTM